MLAAIAVFARQRINRCRNYQPGEAVFWFFQKASFIALSFILAR
jgi:hypothetical protein